MKVTMTKGQMSLVGPFIAIMVAVIVGVAIAIPVIQTELTTATALGSGSETNVAARNGTTLTLAYGDLTSGSFAVTAANGTDTYTITSANYTLSLGSQNTKATVAWEAANNVSLTHANVTYTYYPSTYIQNSTVITLLQLIPLFLVLAILIAVVTLVRF